MAAAASSLMREWLGRTSRYYPMILNPTSIESLYVAFSETCSRYSARIKWSLVIKQFILNICQLKDLKTGFF